MSRREIREKVIQTLYECEFRPEEQEEIVSVRSTGLAGEERSYFLHLTEGILQNAFRLDEVFRPLLKKGWSLERIPTVDKMILRLAIFELLYEKDVPKAVVINEAVELAKSFSGEESGRFINGVLGRVAKEEAGQITEQ
ncbi:transcription antitermination factor NusB [Thermoactinomyces intermedius]|jgi:transcription antitermination protein NusB|uniref:Transcription antitermination protein NusB n=1 Tax=Thermoactinomyces intermedius TaxID=2024 RepID=A0A8I1DE03_THEIN|nr:MULTISPECIES: transcription antitermination factor NusB [Thermoactinomyces]MBA4548554.1 transcription antitermination factor NusB [Thermoactinomyces intermedius]MBA4835806.1 transcription antitermination factor NusB [Thermoactinomyces intermedius]MBH8594432.1 transcription antitermination factor NusB [Thermoactinomyces intermedius]MBH8601663.1 transcription antitermination factor NusB [Thermoactinomyces sp. CICC 23799]